ncbi:cyclase family protein [Natronorubrum sp. JWXQ-INN-674]|uniref:Cyclase family protein n=1 Tax=Natronorubrum halalkaliphilum TaxID=2691917 RepID=A0A6B0VQF3_9EURY|nr:cyclase family protein [Natronorubrum halalkaliphilum]MXV63012.1 cyclase family protein [Natronorubrum halalkaliphilum]
MTESPFPRSAALDGKEIIDISTEIYEGMPVYPGHQRTAIYDMKTHEETKDRYGEDPLTTATLGVIFSDHGPTHTDAMNHIDSTDGSQSIEEMPLHMFYTDAVCVDVSDYIRSSEDYLSAEQLQDQLEEDGLEVNTGETVLLYTGHWNRNWDTYEWLYDYGGLTREATQWLADQGVVNIGVDAPSIDSSVEMTRRKNGEDDDYPAHRVCKEERVTNTENLTNLDKVAGERFLYVGIPLPIRDGTGSPVRAVAITDDE